VTSAPQAAAASPTNVLLVLFFWDMILALYVVDLNGISNLLPGSKVQAHIDVEFDDGVLIKPQRWQQLKL
jgi:hypothetical protein